MRLGYIAMIGIGFVVLICVVAVIFLLLNRLKQKHVEYIDLKTESENKEINNEFAKDELSEEEFKDNKKVIE